MSPKSATAYEPLRQQGVTTHQHPQQFSELENGVFDPQPFPAAKTRPPAGLLQRLLLRPRLRAIVLAVSVLAIGISLLAVLPSRYHMIAQPGLVEIGGTSTKNLVGQGSGSGGDSSSTVSEGSDTPDSSADLKTPVYPALEVGDALASIHDEEDGDAQVIGSKAPSNPEPQPSDATGGGVTGAVTADEQADQLTLIRTDDATSDNVGNPRTDGDGADQKHLEGDLPGSPISRNGVENLSSSSTIPDLLAEKTSDPDKPALAPSGKPASARPGEGNEDDEDDEIDGTDISLEDAGSGEGDGASWTTNSGGNREGSADEKNKLSGEGEEGSTRGGVGEELGKTVPTSKNDDVLAAKPDPELNASDSNEVGELGGEASDVGDEQQEGQLDQAGTKAGPALTPSTSASLGNSGATPEPAGAAEPSESGTPSPAIGGLPALADDDENSAAETRPAALEGGHVRAGTKISADNDAECLLDDSRLPTTGSEGAGAVASAKPPAVVNPLCGATTPGAQSLQPLPLPASPPAPASPVDNAVAAGSALKGGELDAFKGGAADIPADDAGAPSRDKENGAKDADNIDKLVNVEEVTSEGADNNDESDSAAERGTSEDDEGDSEAENDTFEDAKDDEGDSTEKTTSEGAEDDERDSTVKGTSEGAEDEEWDSSQRIGPDNAKDDEGDSDEGDSDEDDSDEDDSEEDDGDERDSSQKIASENKEDDVVDSSEDDEGDSANTIASKDAAHGEVGSAEKSTSKKTEDNNGFSSQMLAPDDTEDQDGDSAPNVASEHDEVESAGKAASEDVVEDDGDSAEKVASDDADHDQVGSAEKVASDDADHDQVGSAEKVASDDADHNQVGTAEKVASDDAGHDQMRSAGKIAPKDGEDGQGDGAENDASENAAG